MGCCSRVPVLRSGLTWGGVRGGEGSEVLELRLCEMQMWVL